MLELLRHRLRSIVSLHVAEDAEFSAEFRSLLERARESHLEVLTESKQRLAALVPGVRTQGVVATVKPEPAVSLKALLEHVQSKSATKPIVALDQITDPQNFGAILRVAEAAGASGVVATMDRSSPLNATVRRVSVGASELIPMCLTKNLQRSLTELKSAGYWIIGFESDTSSKPLYDVELPESVVLVFGSEGAGLRKLTSEMCDLMLSIPMDGKVQSLNVSSAASVVLFELLRRRQTAT